MRFIVEWVNATRPPDEKIWVETVVCHSILDFYGGGVERAKQSYDITSETPEVLAMIGQELFILVIGQARVTSPPRNMPDLLSKLPLSKER